MLEPREADIPVLFLVLVVLPIVTYILLGKWSEASTKKARINVLTHLAAEEALRVETIVSANATPTVSYPFPNTPTVTYSLPKAASHGCARCLAPATTRCSRCKSVKYCSGKCQIIHWRQGHKQECQQWKDSSPNPSSCIDSVQMRPFIGNSKHFLENDIEEPLYSGFLSDISSEASFVSIGTSQDSVSERKLSDSEKRVSNKHKKQTSRTRSDDTVSCPFEDTSGYGAAPPNISGSPLLTEISSSDGSLGPKLGTGYLTSSAEVDKCQDISSQIYSHAPTALRNVMHQSHKLTGESRYILKPGCSCGNSENCINECENGSKFTLEGGLSPASETLELNLSAEDTGVRGSILYKRPPYTLGSISTFSRNSAEKMPIDRRSHGVEKNAYMDDDSRVSAENVSTSISGNSHTVGMKTAGPKKSSKVQKLSLVGLVNDNSKMLFPYEDLVKLFQCEVRGISPRGLHNCGNSCYANAVLQCLTCTKPLMIYLLRRSHSKTCLVRNWCLMCELEQHVSLLLEGGGPLSPSRILSNMRNIGCQMGGGDQEDAHEFLRLLVMSMQSICLEGLGGEKKVNPRLQETTLIQQIFGGRLKSKVKCMRCHLESERYENIMDLTLEIHGWVESLEDALTQFTAPEDLDGENMYRCGRCAAYVKARKQLSVHEVPNILTIVLKRFQTGKYGKINKCVTFPDMLDMIPFVTRNADSPPLYMLYGVVVHLDNLNASFSGHYVSYVKDLQGTWFRINDAEVQAVPLSEVMCEGAYMLFYSRSFPRPPIHYVEKAQLQDSNKHAACKTQKTLRRGQQKQSGACFASEIPVNGGNGFRNSCNLQAKGTFADSFSMDFSDATSSDWSLFTSSDEASFTTESTRDSFSTVDHEDSAGLDPISSIFAPPFYVPEYPQSNRVSCKKFSPYRPQTRFFSERRDFVSDSSLPTQPFGNVHKQRNSEQVCVSSKELLGFGGNCSLYGRNKSNPREGFVQISGSCGL